MKPLALAAAVALLAPAFPPPKLVPQTPDMKCDWGSIATPAIDRPEIVLSTDAGPFVLAVGPGVKVVALDGAELGSVKALHAGQHVRAYYVVDTGAKAREIDVIP
jgi:hypothetical protein